MRVLVLGSGGREHALCWKLYQEGVEVHSSPGNGGITTVAQVHSSPATEEGGQGYLRLAEKVGADLVVIGPEALLMAGVADACRAEGFKVFGPGREAAIIEGSKAWAKEFMARHRIPTATFTVAHSPIEARRYLRQKGVPLVIKADGLAAGKGVVVAETETEAEEAISRLMEDRVYGEAGTTVVLEEKLSGQELSLLAFTDGERVAVMPPARDYKRLLDGNEGPNTGGMGSIAPVPAVTPSFLREVEEAILLPAVRGLAGEGRPFQGVLYAGLMLTPEGPKVLEFNARFGDPETQVLLPLLETNLLEILLACTEGRFQEVDIRWRQEAAATVVLASEGYPEKPKTGVPITGLAEAEVIPGLVIFHAGTQRLNGEFFTAGGRVLNITARGKDLKEALARAYRGAEIINFPRKHYRRDIGT